MSRVVGFSTGALAYADFRRGLRIAMDHPKCMAVEMSALRFAELSPMLMALRNDEFLANQLASRFDYVSIHAPSRAASREQEREVWAALGEHAVARQRSWPIVVHPDAILDYGLWRELGDRVCIENMDRRKTVGRNARELEKVFAELPEATFCFDIGHAKQCDSSMVEACVMLAQFAKRLRQLHVSEVSAQSRHNRLSYLSIVSFQEVASMIPDDIPLILESPLAETELDDEILRLMQALPSTTRVPASAIA